jgi:hypothetical protein
MKQSAIICIIFAVAVEARGKKCKYDKDCKKGDVCENGQCIAEVKKCKDNKGCSEGLQCVGNVCVEPEVEKPTEVALGKKCDKSKVCAKGLQCNSKSICEKTPEVEQFEEFDSLFAQCENPHAMPCDDVATALGIYASFCRTYRGHPALPLMIDRIAEVDRKHLEGVLALIPDLSQSPCHMAILMKVDGTCTHPVPATDCDATCSYSWTQTFAKSEADAKNMCDQKKSCDQGDCSNCPSELKFQCEKARYLCNEEGKCDKCPTQCSKGLSFDCKSKRQCEEELSSQRLLI